MKEIHANANLKQAAEEHLVRYGGDQFENLFTSAKDQKFPLTNL